MKTQKDKNISIHLKKTIHKKEVVLLLLFPYNDAIISQIRDLKKYTWSKTLRGWITPFSEEKLQEIQTVIKGNILFVLAITLSERVYQKGVKTQRNITESNKVLVRNFIKYLKGKRYSESTIKTYFTFIADFIDYVQPKSIEKITNKDVELFLEDVFVPRKYSISSQRQFISSLKLFIDD